MNWKSAVILVFLSLPGLPVPSSRFLCFSVVLYCLDNPSGFYVTFLMIRRWENRDKDALCHRDQNKISFLKLPKGVRRIIMISLKE
jgi:hypothetical protein